MSIYFLHFLLAKHLVVVSIYMLLKSCVAEPLIFGPPRLPYQFETITYDNNLYAGRKLSQWKNFKWNFQCPISQCFLSLFFG